MNPTIRQLVMAGASGAATLGILVAAPSRAEAAPACGNAPISWATVFSGAFACQVGNAIVDSFFTAYVPSADTTASAAFAFFDGIYDIEFQVNPASNFEPPATFAYRFTLLDPNEVVVGAALDVSGNGVRPRPGTTNPGEYAGIARILNPDLSDNITLTSIDGVRDPAGVGFTSLSPSLNSLFVAQGVGTDPQLPSGISPTINQVSNQFITETRTDTVPGPLGVAGVGAMLVSARKLRRRIKAVA